MVARGPGANTVRPLLRGDWPWQIGALDESSPCQDTTRIVLTVIAGLGAAVALVVAYRRQRNAELGGLTTLPLPLRCSAPTRPPHASPGVRDGRSRATARTSTGSSASTSCAPTCGCPPGRTYANSGAAVQNTRRTIAVLSPEYFASEFSEAEWRTTFAADPTGTALKLIPVKVRAVQPLGMLRTRVYIDVCDLPEHEARIELINGVDENVRRAEAAPFPGRPASPS